VIFRSVFTFALQILSITLFVGSEYRTGKYVDLFKFKQINQPDATVLQVYYLTFCVAQHVSGASTPIIRRLQRH